MLDIWLARFLAGGIEIGDIEPTCGRIDTWADWGPRWMETAAVHEDLWERALAERRIVSALEAFLIAARCYHLGYFLAVNDLDLHGRGLPKMVACHDRVLPFDRPAVEKVTIPFQATHLVALFSQPQGARALAGGPDLTGPFGHDS